MPRLPGLPRLQAGPAPAPRRASGEDFGAGVGAARQQRAGVLDQVAEASERILSAREGARAGRALSEAQLELEQVHDSLRDDPDESTHEARFEAATKEIGERHRKSLFGAWQGEFADRFAEASTRGAMRVRDGVRTRRIQAGIADTNATIETLSDLYARSGDDAHLEQGAEAVGRAAGAGLITPEQARESVATLRSRGARGLFLRLVREDPMNARQLLVDRAGGMQNMSELERESALAEAELGIAHDLQERRAATELARREREDARKRAADEAQKSADELLFAGRTGELQQLLAQTRDVMDAGQRRFYLDAIRDGGRAPEGKTNRAVYSDLYGRAAAGEPVAGEIDTAYRAGDLTREDRDRLIGAQEDRRFGEPEKFLRDSLEVGESALGQERFVAQAKSAEALRAFGDWKRDHPDATRAEAFEESRRLVQEAAVVDLSQLEVAQLAPRYAVRGDDGRIDIAATAAATQAALDSGQLDAPGFEEQKRRILRIRAAQQRAGATK